MGIKERRTNILLSIFLTTDASFSPVKFDARIQKIFNIPFNQKTRGTISGLIKEGSLQKSEDELAGDNSYLLTEKGFYGLCLKFPFFRFLKDEWDKKWRVISYEIPERRRELRDRLRREMQGWGLGPWHRSFWLTPHPIIKTLRQLIFQKEEEKYIQAFLSEHSLGNRAFLIEKVWKISSLDKEYRELFKRWHNILSSNNDKLIKFEQVINEYITILKIDPGLPKDLLGEKWIGFEAFDIYKEMRKILLG